MIYPNDPRYKFVYLFSENKYNIFLAIPQPEFGMIWCWITFKNDDNYSDSYAIPTTRTMSKKIFNIYEKAVSMSKKYLNLI